MACNLFACPHDRMYLMPTQAIYFCAHGYGMFEKNIYFRKNP